MLIPAVTARRVCSLPETVSHVKVGLGLEVRSNEIVNEGKNLRAPYQIVYLSTVRQNVQIMALFSDIDECSLQIDVCDHTCVNTDPGYNCSCNDGFYLDEDMASCLGESKICRI